MTIDRCRPSRRSIDDIEPCPNETRDRIITGRSPSCRSSAWASSRWQLWASLAGLERPHRLRDPLRLDGAAGSPSGFHRLFTHRSFKTDPAVRGVLRRASARWPSRARSSPGWPTIASTTRSPTGPATRTARTSTTARACAARCAASPTRTSAGCSCTRTAAAAAATRRTCSPIPIVRWVDRWFVALRASAGSALAFLLGIAIGGTLTTGLTGLLWGGAVRLLVLHHVTYSINSLCHFFGRRAFATKDESRNLFWLSFFTFGEAWHNNHHAFPTSHAHGLRGWQFDPSAWVIRGLEKCGLAWDVVRVRPERQAAKAAEA